MTKNTKLTITAGAVLSLMTPVLSAVPAFAATAPMACGIGQSAGECQGAQNAGGGEWAPPTITMDTTAPVAGSTDVGSISITGPAKLDIPYYSIIAAGNATRWYQGPGLVQSWVPPVGTAANAFVIPNTDAPGTADVTLDMPNTTGESGTYDVAFPAMSVAGGVKILSGPAQMTFTGAAANTIQVVYTANEPIFSLSQNGPWTSSITVPAGVASWSNVPANPAGLVVHANPVTMPSGADERWQYGPSSGAGQVLLPAASAPAPTPTPSPTPKPTPKKPVVTPSPTPAPVTKEPVVTPSPQPKIITPTPKKTATPKPKAVTPKPAKKVVPMPKIVTISKAAIKAALVVHAPARAQANHPIPVAIRLSQNGRPVADKTVRLTVSAGTLTQSAVKTNDQGIAHDSITHAPTGKILISAKRASLVAGAMVMVSAPVAPFPWLLLVALTIIIALLVFWLRRRRRHRANVENDTDE